MKEQMMMETFPPIHRMMPLLALCEKEGKNQRGVHQDNDVGKKRSKDLLQELNGDGKRAPQTLGSIMAMESEEHKYEIERKDNEEVGK
jgi:hypothetical protein